MKLITNGSSLVVMNTSEIKYSALFAMCKTNHFSIKFIT